MHKHYSNYQNMSSHYPSVLVWKIFTSKHYFLYKCGSCCKQFFCVSVFLQTLFFTCIQFILVFTASANNLFQHFPHLRKITIVHFRITSMGLFVNLFTVETFSFFLLGCCVLFQLTFSNPVLCT